MESHTIRSRFVEELLSDTDLYAHNEKDIPQDRHQLQEDEDTPLRKIYRRKEPLPLRSRSMKELFKDTDLYEETDVLQYHRQLQSQQQQEAPLSNVHRIGNTRFAHLVSFYPLTTLNTTSTARSIVDFRVYFEASAWLAFFHLTRPEYAVLPGIRQRLESCDIRFTLSLFDTELSPLVAARHLFSILSNTTDTTNSSSALQLLPVCIVGATRSVVSTLLATLGNAYDLPQVSALSTAASLDQQPLFARTVPSDAAGARAIALVFEEWQVTHVAVLYIADSFGINFHADLIKEAALRQISVVSVAYTDSPESMERAIAQLADSGHRYFVSIISGKSWRTLVRLAVARNIMGRPGYTWLSNYNFLELVGPSSSGLNQQTETDLARALHGVGVLRMQVQPFDPFDDALERFSRNIVQRQRFISQHADPDILQNFSFPVPGRSQLYRYLSYDAVMAIGITACECKTDLFTGRELYEQLLRTEFEGVSGHVSFDPDTGTRQKQEFSYQIQNLLVSDALSGNQTIRFTAPVAMVVDLSNDSVVQVQHYVFSDNSTIPPHALPELNVDLNLISDGVRILGWSLSGLVMTMSIGWIVWTWRNRNKDIVRASQPVFLCQLCIGTFVMASSVIPMSLQEPVSENGLNVACMFIPWLISIGFVTAWSALFAKMWRLNRLLQHGQVFRRITVRPQDVMLPFFCLFIVNIIFLTAWTTVSPLIWERTAVANFDQYGRSVESYGSCRSSQDNLVLVFLIPILAVECCALLFANYQCYLARNLPTDFSESSYLGISMASLLETFILGIPLLFFSLDNPTTSFLVRSLLVIVTCLTILLPVFVPKYIQRNRNEQRLPSPIQHCSPGVTTKQPKVHVTVSGNDRVQVSRLTDTTISKGESSEFCNLSVQSLATGTTRVTRNDEYYRQRAQAESS